MFRLLPWFPILSLPKLIFCSYFTVNNYTQIWHYLYDTVQMIFQKWKWIFYPTMTGQFILWTHNKEVLKHIRHLVTRLNILMSPYCDEIFFIIRNFHFPLSFWLINDRTKHSEILCGSFVFSFTFCWIFSNWRPINYHDVSTKAYVIKTNMLWYLKCGHL